jgi:hypothetical protein
MSKFASASFKTLKCRDCGEPVEKVDGNAVAVTCWKCVIKMVGGHHHNPEEDDKTINQCRASDKEQPQK